MAAKLTVLLTLVLFITFADSVPFIVLYGIGEGCQIPLVQIFTKYLSDASGSQGFCVQIGNGPRDSWTIPLSEQTAIACEKVKEMSVLRQGYNIVGRSQGALIGRGIVEFCDDGPPVKNLISLGGPHAGVASVPFCHTESVCSFVDQMIKLGIYHPHVQKHLAPSGYVKIPTEVPRYLSKSRFLPKLNNEISSERNPVYKQRFTSLQNLVLIMFECEAIVVPKESSWFGYYPDGAFHPVLAPQETQLYIDDWIGLRTLDKAGRVKFITVPGFHSIISPRDMKSYIVPYLLDQPSNVKNPKIEEKPVSHGRMSSNWTFGGLNKDEP